MWLKVEGPAGAPLTQGRWPHLGGKFSISVFHFAKVEVDDYICRP